MSHVTKARRDTFVCSCSGSFEVLRSLKNSSTSFVEGPSEFRTNSGCKASSISSILSTAAESSSASDEDISPMYTTESPPSVLQGPITRARARQLNQQVNSFLSSSTYTDKDGTLERIRKGLDTSKESERNKEDVQVKLEAQSKSSSSLPRPAGPFDTKTETQDAYGLRFRRSTYAWKDKNISFPMPLVSGLLEFGVDGKSLWKGLAFVARSTGQRTVDNQRTRGAAIAGA
ncbi:hypothetical protein U9M48_019305 [Paspalum notatum var. saurae]|uniref:Uncharacterized protein n=1 Tax=Paspalum notatum var. saurae TaxID=547442 RepID=A0AAQ3WRE7_PASNO